MGGSYGGFMTLAAITTYPHLWAAAVDIVGVANFVTFLEHTGPWRCKLRESEYGSLETAARVDGANIVELVEHATGINLWHEWARIETSSEKESYHLPYCWQDYSGVIITLARQEQPDTSAYQDEEIVRRMNKHHHIGFVVVAKNPERVATLLEDYQRRFEADFHATLPPFESRPPSGH